VVGVDGGTEAINLGFRQHDAEYNLLRSQRVPARTNGADRIRSETAGTCSIGCSMPTWPSPRSEQLGTPNPPAIRSTRVKSFGASRFTHLLRPAKLLAPLYGSDRYARPPGAFTSRLPTDRLPSPLLGMTTTATGLLCWRDFHPLECQLASLHQIRLGLILREMAPIRSDWACQRGEIQPPAPAAAARAPRAAMPPHRRAA
jgi:hypothetical protein